MLVDLGIFDTSNIHCPQIVSVKSSEGSCFNCLGPANALYHVSIASHHPGNDAIEKLLAELTPKPYPQTRVTNHAR